MSDDEQLNTFLTLQAVCQTCPKAAFGRNAVEVMVQHQAETSHEIQVDCGQFARKPKNREPLTAVDPNHTIFRTLHAHCLKCAHSEHGFGAVDRMIEHCDVRNHKWTFDYKHI